MVSAGTPFSSGYTDSDWELIARGHGGQAIDCQEKLLRANHSSLESRSTPWKTDKHSMGIVTFLNARCTARLGNRLP